MASSRDDFVIAIRSAFLKKSYQQKFSLLTLIFLSLIVLILGSFNFKAIQYIKIGVNEIVYRSSFIASIPENYFKDLNINLNASRNYSTQAGEFYRWNPSSTAFESQSRFESSTLTFTTISWGTAFAKMDSSFRSPIFQQMIANSQQISQLIGVNNPNSSSLPGGYYDGYSATQQEVVIGSFLTAYTNSPIDNKTINPRSNMPLPNWTINYAGLSKFAFNHFI